MPEMRVITPPNMNKTPDSKGPVVPFCHRMYIPIPFAEQIPATQITPAQMRPAGDVRFLQCLGAQCALWNKEKSACADLVGTKAQIETLEFFKEKDERTVISLGTDQEQ